MARKRNDSKVTVFLVHQNPSSDTSPHHASKTLAALLAQHLPFLVNYDKQSATLQLRRAQSWSALKLQLREALDPRGIPQLLPPRAPEPLMLHYPPIPQGTDG